MNLILKIVNTPKESINKISHEFKKEGGTVGRDSDCSWVLNDKSGVVSRKHLEIEYKHGKYFMVDVSSNGTLYKRENRRVPPKELVVFREGDLLTIGPYEILVEFEESSSTKDVVTDLLNKREIDVAIEEKMLLKDSGDTPLDTIFEKRVKDENILELTNIVPKTESISLADAFDDDFEEEADNLYTTHISPPTFEEPKEQEQKATVVSSGGDELLLKLLSSKLGLRLTELSPEEQLRVIGDLADGILQSVDGVTKLSDRANTIAQKLEKPQLKVSEPKKSVAKALLGKLLYQKESLSLTEYIKEKVLEVSLHQTALYEASKEQCAELQREFAPNSLEQQLKGEGFSAKLLSKDAVKWRGYVAKYNHLNDEPFATKGFSSELYKKYKAFMERFKLSKV